MLDGDGYVCRFSFAGGNKVHFLSRYVQTRQATASLHHKALLSGALATLDALQLPQSYVLLSHLCVIMTQLCT